MMKNNKGQMFVSLILFIMVIIIFILASPMIFNVINENIGSMGSATAFIVKLFLWVILITFIAYFLKIISGGEGFFIK
jgi:hypothetical protein